MVKYTWIYTNIWYGICGALMTMLMTIQPLNFAVALVMWKVISALKNLKKMYMKNNSYETSTTWDMRHMTNNDGRRASMSEFLLLLSYSFSFSLAGQ